MTVHGPDAAAAQPPDFPGGAAFAGLATGFGVVGPGGDLQFADEVLGTWLGRPLGGDPAPNLRDVVVEPFADAAGERGATTVVDLLAAARPWAGAVRCCDATTRRFDAVLSLQPLHDGRGRLLGCAVELRDVERQRAIERQLQQAQRLQALGQFTTAVAHDFNNLLTVVHGHIGLIEAGGEATPAVRDALGEMSQAVARATTLTRQLLSSQRQGPRFERLDVNQVVRRMAVLMGRVVGNTIQIAPRLALQPAWVHADAGMLDQVLMNLCLNARDAMPAGGRLDLVVELVRERPATGSSAPTGSFVRLTVADTGCGIAPEHRSRVFEPFFTTKLAGQGSGLGLAVVQTIVRQHDGACGLESEVGRGTRVYIWLPEASAPVVPAPVVAPPAAQVAGGAERVLVVEDDPALATLLRKTLEAAGYRVDRAETGRQALDLWHNYPRAFDLLVTDVRTPDGMRGDDLADRLARDKPGLPVVFTGAVEPGSAGSEGRVFLMKPFSRRELLQVVRQAIDGRSR
ncbi:MAG: response regulator [Planctomycetes bacterium]|nr:response regulator [Planctomycetota bacterium]